MSQWMTNKTKHAPSSPPSQSQTPDSKEEQAKRHIIENPTRDDVHEQREPHQPREGVVHEGGAPPRK